MPPNALSVRRPPRPSCGPAAALLPARRLATAAVAALCAVVALAAPLATAHAGFPERPIRMILPYTPGGSSDAAARLVAEGMARELGQPVIVENRPGAGGVIGAAAVAAAEPDGYTLLFTITSLIQTAALPNEPPFDVFEHFAPVSEVARTNFILVGGSQVRADTLAELIADAKANPGSYSNGSYGAGTSSHLYGELFKKTVGVDMVHVPYKGGAPMITDLLAGQIPVAFSDIGSARAFLDSGKVKVYAATGTERFPILPDVPTFAELGVAGMDLDGWYGVLAPAGTDAAVIETLSAAIARTVRSPEVRARFHDIALAPVGGTPADLAAMLRRDEPKWTQIIRDAGIARP